MGPYISEYCISSSLWNCVLRQTETLEGICLLSIWLPFLRLPKELYKRKIPVYHLTTRWRRTKRRQNILPPPNPTTNLPKFKFLHNTVHVNTHFFSRHLIPFSSNNSVSRFLLTWRSLIGKQVSVLWKPSRQAIYIQIQKEKKSLLQSE